MNKSSNCIFYLLNTSSHYNATYRIARELKSNGYNPIYIGGRNMQESVSANGFDFYEYSVRIYCISNGVFHNDNDFEKEKEKIDFGNYERNFIQGGYFDPIIKRFDPKIFFLDASKIGFFPDLYRNEIKFVILSTKVNLNRDKYIPPVSSGIFFKKRNLLNQMICNTLWSKAILKKNVEIRLSKINKGGFSLYMLPLKYIQQNNLTGQVQINQGRESGFGLYNVPEIILSPKVFDYPGRKSDKNQVYIGPTSDLNRKEIVDPTVNKFLQKERIVYCSMGSYDLEYQKYRIQFVDKIIEVANRMKDYNFIVSIGNDLQVATNQIFSKNLLIKNNLPQITILNHAILMISHGGMQSITESIQCQVPLLIYALNPNLDQKGNAARVKFHNIGREGNIKTDSVNKMITRINEILNDKRISESVDLLYQKFNKSQDFEKGINFILDYIKS